MRDDAIEEKEKSLVLLINKSLKNNTIKNLKTTFDALIYKCKKVDLLIQCGKVNSYRNAVINNSIKVPINKFKFKYKILFLSSEQLGKELI